MIGGGGGGGGGGKSTYVGDHLVATLSLYGCNCVKILLKLHVFIFQRLIKLAASTDVPSNYSFRVLEMYTRRYSNLQPATVCHVSKPEVLQVGTCPRQDFI